MEMQQETIRETVGVFNDIHALNEAIAELEVTAFPRHDISILDEKHIQKQGMGISRAALEDDPDAPRTIHIRPEEKTIGGGVMVGGGLYAGVVTGMLISGIDAPMTTLMAMGLAGGVFGALLGGVVAWLLGHYYTGILQQQMRKGRLILWVRTPGQEEERLASDIMKKHGGQRVHVHEIH
jgi:hypothetical protein